MKNSKTLNLKKRLFYSLLFFTLISFSANAQSEERKQVESESIKIVVPNTPIEKHDIIVRMEDENGNEMKYIVTRDEYRIMENRVREYEKENGITDRSKNIYVINDKFEPVKVTTNLKD